MNNILTIKYWFSLNPGPWAYFGKYLFVILVLLFVLAVFLQFAPKIFKCKGAKAKFLLKFSVWSFTWSILGLLFWFFRWQQIPFFSARFWFFIMVILAGIWAVFIVLYLRKRLAKEKQEIKKSQEFDKYLPV